MTSPHRSCLRPAAASRFGLPERSTPLLIPQTLPQLPELVVVVECGYHWEWMFYFYYSIESFIYYEAGLLRTLVSSWLTSRRRL
jgi:hypothetical protein